VSQKLLEAGIRPEGGALPEPIMGWRVWALHSNRGHTELRMHPIAGNAPPWPPLEPARAGCTRRRRHRGPQTTCTCGLYATRDPDVLHRARNPSVVGTVALWGPSRSAAHEVVRLRGGRLVPLCHEHLQLSRRYGYPSRRFAGADEVEVALLSTYAVDLLRV